MTQDEAYNSAIEQFEARFLTIERIDPEQFKNFIYSYDYSQYNSIGVVFLYQAETNNLTITITAHEENNEIETELGSQIFYNLGPRLEEVL